MATIKWEAPASIATILSTELNDLGNGSNKLSSAQSNDAAGELYLFADFELYCAAATNRVAGAYVALYILIEIDGTNYTYGGDSLDPPASAWAGNFPLPSGETTARYVHLREVPLPPQDFKVLLMNETGVAFSSSGNTLKWVKYNYQSA